MFRTEGDMSETKNPGDKTISVERKTLGLKRTGLEQGTVRQSFSHGRSKAVVVEKKKRRITLPGQEGKPEAETTVRADAQPERRPEADRVAPRADSARRPSTSGTAQRSRGSGTVLRTLTEEEAAARAAALREAQIREVEERKRREEEARRQAELEARRKAEEEARRALEAEEAARRAAEESTAEPEAKPAEAEPVVAEPAVEQPVARKPETPKIEERVPSRLKPEVDDEDEGRKTVKAVKRPKSAPVRAPSRTGEDRRRSKLTIAAATGDSEEGRSRSLAA